MWSELEGHVSFNQDICKQLFFRIELEKLGENN